MWETTSGKQLVQTGKNEGYMRFAEPHLKAVAENKLGMQVRFSTIQLSYQNRSVFFSKVLYLSNQWKIFNRIL